MPTIDPISPKLSQAVPKEPSKEEAAPRTPLLDAKAYAEEIRQRRGLRSISEMESHLSFVGSPPEGWTRRWVNDIEDSIPTRLMDGWRFVSPSQIEVLRNSSLGRNSEDIGDRISITSNVGDGRAIKVYLMEIPTEIAEEILEARSYRRVRAFEDTIRRGGVAGPISTQNVYIPNENPQSSFYHALPNTIGVGEAKP